MHPPVRVVRRMLLPLFLLVLLVVLALLMLSAVILGLAAPLTSRRRPLRLVLFGLAYCLMEVAVIVVAGLLWLQRALRPFVGASDERWRRAHRSVLTRALAWVLMAARRCLNFQVVLAETSSVETFAEDGPVLVLARHGGLGDSFALAHMLLTRFDRGVRIVLKDVLQFDPALDIVLNRLGCCFVSPGGSDEGTTERLAALAVDLRSDDALLLFPEGANWTPTRRLRAIRHLRSVDNPEAARAAGLMSNVLPPRPGGVLACLDARPDLRTAIVAHAGLDRIVSAHQVWQQLPLTVPMTIRIWPAPPAPPSLDEKLAWLTTEWAVVDQWVDGHHSAGLDQPDTLPVALPGADQTTSSEPPSPSRGLSSELGER